MIKTFFKCFYWFFVNFTSCNAIPLISHSPQTHPPHLQPLSNIFFKNVLLEARVCQSVPQYTLFSRQLCLPILIAMTCYSHMSPLISATLLIRDLIGSLGYLVVALCHGDPIVLDL